MKKGIAWFLELALVALIAWITISDIGVAIPAFVGGWSEVFLGLLLVTLPFIWGRITGGDKSRAAQHLLHDIGGERALPKDRTSEADEPRHSKKRLFQMWKTRGFMLILAVIWIGSYVNQFIPNSSWLLAPVASTEGALILLGIVTAVMDLAGVNSENKTAHPEETDKSGPSSPAPKS